MLRKLEKRSTLPLGRWSRLFLLAVTFVPGGCGWLFDYENQMASQQERLQRFDEESTYLDLPVDVPAKRKEGTKEVEVADVFFRPPRGISSIVDKNAAPQPFFRYLREQRASTNTKAQPAICQEVYLAVVPSDQKDFVKTVARGFPALGDVPPKRLPQKLPPGRDPLIYDAYENTQTGFSLYVCQRGGWQVAIGYHLDKGKPGGKGIDLSLESVGVGPEAAKMKTAWSKRSHARR